jgi:hypothetical protein
VEISLDDDDGGGGDCGGGDDDACTGVVIITNVCFPCIHKIIFTLKTLFLF